MQLPIEIRVQYTESLVKRAVMRFWMRLIGWRGFAALALTAFAVIFLLATGDSSPIVIVVGTVLVSTTLIGLSSFLIYRTRMLTTFRQLDSPTILITLTDSGLTTRSELDGSDVSWRRVNKVSMFPEMWLLFISGATYYAIPTELLTEETRQFIRDKVRDHRGAVA